MASDDEDSLPLRELARLAGGACTDCRTPYTPHEAVWCVALGFKDAPRCLACLCRRLGREPAEFAAQLTDYVTRRECYLVAWRHADTLTGRPVTTPTTPTDDAPAPADDWDAGGLGCGELMMELRRRMNSLPAGGVLTVTATDPSAPEDIPAWCRLVGHTLASATPPVYRIRRREG